MKFLRQLYKTDLKTETMEDLEQPEGAGMERRFRGVAGDQKRKGELFGLANLLSYKDGNFRNYKSTTSSNIRQYGSGVYLSEDVRAAVVNMPEQEFKTLGPGTSLVNVASQSFPADANPAPQPNGLEEGRPLDDEPENELGGESQVDIAVLEKATTTEAGNPKADLAPKNDSTANGDQEPDEPSSDEDIGGETQINMAISERAQVEVGDAADGAQ